MEGYYRASNVSIFDKWKPYLEKQGVKFKVNTSRKKVDPENNIVYTDKEAYNADQIIVSCSLSSAVKITKSLSTKVKVLKLENYILVFRIILY